MITHSAVPGKHIHPHHHGTGGHGHKGLALLALTFILGGFTAVSFLLLPNPELQVSASPEAFIEQMVRAAQGSVFEKNIYGGAIRVERKGGQVAVTAHDIPPSVCVSVGWKLVRKGVLSINGVTPLRVSAGKLAELCNQDDAAATLVWSPKIPE
ncbi:hypothetical protein CU669_07095 [Paramagnetospirillum kuznetsovii]|uniref:Type 4 secretion system PilS N-terminal domain-containing protein n=1 Tax=Paramagnetospirillum kuznetsovii TaxID=2053833 RepID=A0A364NZF2_9PROT|nr:hypothetical protein [Paramagnetospirillum kuznetsovii]RAU22462.1 hypothetical protein CU669_07095 [Paramagnetospirillum kuznetsovii]